MHNVSQTIGAIRTPRTSRTSKSEALALSWFNPLTTALSVRPSPFSSVSFLMCVELCLPDLILENLLAMVLGHGTVLKMVLSHRTSLVMVLERVPGHGTILKMVHEHGVILNMVLGHDVVLRVVLGHCAVT